MDILTANPLLLWLTQLALLAAIGLCGNKICDKFLHLARMLLRDQTVLHDPIAVLFCGRNAYSVVTCHDIIERVNETKSGAEEEYTVVSHQGSILAFKKTGPNEGEISNIKSGKKFIIESNDPLILAFQEL